jgi:hypothetical protein
MVYPHINKETGYVNFPSWKAFVQKFQAAFQDPDALATAERKVPAYVLHQRRHNITV